MQPYVSLGLHKRFSAHCAAVGATESAVAEAAIAQFLDGISDHALVMRRLDRLGRAVERADRDVQLLSEAFAVWVQIWFAHTPAIAASERSAARRESAARFQQFVDFVAAKVSGGRRFVDSLPRESVADEEELRAIAKGDGEAPGGGEVVGVDGRDDAEDGGRREGE